MALFDNVLLWLGIYTFFLYFAQLQHAYQTVSEENAENKQALLAARHKDETSSAMINELTQVNAAKSTSSKESINYLYSLVDFQFEKSG